MVIFLTGGTGFIGSHFIKSALEVGHEVIALRRSLNSKPKICLDIEPQWLFKDILEVEELDFSGVDVLVHLAAHSVIYPFDTLENCLKYNVNHPLALFKVAKNAGVSRFVVAGSCFEYGTSGERYEYIPTNAPLEPTSSYSTSKAMATLAFKQFAIDNQVCLSVHRLFQVFGEGEFKTRLWPSLKLAAKSGSDFPMTEGEQVRDFIHVLDVIDNFLEMCKIENFENSYFKIFNVGSGKPQTILNFTKFWWHKWKAEGQLKIGDLPYRKGEIMRYVPEIGSD
ncbi:NAD(P)-dependent oxidoreductase [uncultured Christiangramia sp.]|uniref:NAD-dependent epimerase/dehydratase family protein n=1 Tax=Christiangramia sp. 3-2217-3z TaxID=3417564 RepID=UPI0026209BA5|nr:NAD-dependent epimerase/dehydratase family protein [uncultured Christiangramia sp.]